MRILILFTLTSLVAFSALPGGANAKELCNVKKMTYNDWSGEGIVINYGWCIGLTNGGQAVLTFRGSMRETSGSERRRFDVENMKLTGGCPGLAPEFRIGGYYRIGMCNDVSGTYPNYDIDVQASVYKNPSGNDGGNELVRIIDYSSQ